MMDRTRQDAGTSEAAVGAVPLIGSRLPKLVKSGQVRRAAPIVGADDAGLHAADGAVHRPDTVIRATGSRNDFAWIDIPDVLDEHGQPRHDRGISTTNQRLAFIGLPGLHTKGSAFLGFVGRGAELIMSNNSYWLGVGGRGHRSVHRLVVDADRRPARGRDRSGRSACGTRSGSRSSSGRPDPQFASPVDDGTASGQGWSVACAVLFDPRRQAILLLGGDKSGEWNDWYGRAVPLADDLYDEYLRELGQEGLI
jgi:hypothetical protein